MCLVAVAHLSGGRCASDQPCQELVCGYSNKKQHLLETGMRQPLMALSERGRVPDVCGQVSCGRAATSLEGVGAL